MRTSSHPPVSSIPYRPQDRIVSRARVRTDWIGHMLRDKGVLDAEVDKRVQEAVKKYALDCPRGLLKLGMTDLTMSELESLVDGYWYGYEDGLIHAGLLKERSSP